MCSDQESTINRRRRNLFSWIGVELKGRGFYADDCWMWWTLKAPRVNSAAFRIFIPLKAFIPWHGEESTAVATTKHVFLRLASRRYCGLTMLSASPKHVSLCFLYISLVSASWLPCELVISRKSHRIQFFKAWCSEDKTKPYAVLRFIEGVWTSIPLIPSL